MIDNSAIFKLSYGLFVLFARNNDKDNACIINTAQQVTQEPLRISVTVNKDNLTHALIYRTKKLNLSVLSESVPFDVIKEFGFSSGFEKDKVPAGKYKRAENGICYLSDYSNAYISADVIDTVDLGTHTMFICDVTAAEKLSEVAADCGKRVGVHLKINTGMNRIGISCDDEGLEIAKKIASFENLDIKGVFSHYATADEADKTFCNLQCERFEQFCANLEANGINTGIRHICNSAGIMDTGKYFDMVRPGIILYGLLPSDEVDKGSVSLKPALELKTHVSCVKKIAPGETVSYGRTYTAGAERIIATIPVGYADGYPRLLSNCGRVIIRGQYAPIVGRVCMDQFMVDVTDIDGVKPEDDVVLIGSDGECTISADEIAKLAHTINYEIVCGISKRVPRIYG